MQTLRDLVERLADRDAKRSEATIQADVRGLLLAAPFHLSEDEVREVHLESPAGERRRIDVETGTTVIEVKRDLRRAGTLKDAVEQLTGYVVSREAHMKQRYVGILTDGAEWRCFQLTPDGRLEEASSIVIRREQPAVEALLVWLDGVLGTAREIQPSPSEITARLGAGSSAHSLDQAALKHLYAEQKHHPEVRIKRQLWARLLTTALGSQFEDSDDLFVEHTLLVNTAEVIAHAVLGLEVRQLSPASLLSGEKFAEHGIHGVVEPDFFDWVVQVPRGEDFIRALARRLARFDWRSVEHDVLKILYESMIGAATRKKLGEYYTPDWLAEKMVDVAVKDPLTERVLDPACGSGTFLFHAVRRYFAAATATSIGVPEALAGVSSHVLGVDLHPVAVTLARITYVLAIGPERLAEPGRGSLQIPVYLGDSMQWQQKSRELWTAGYLVIQVDGDFNLFELELRFPGALLADVRAFDALVEELATKATMREPGSPRPSLETVYRKLALPESTWETIEGTFRSMCRLHDEGRNHIWGYYIRNLARPVWLAQPENRIDTLIGNPPWLAYRHMPREMQAKFREMSEARGLWHGATVATHQDLSALFVARVVELYLRRGGHFAFVMPNAALDRAQFAGFRTAELTDPAELEVVRVSFAQPWDLRRLRPHFFPRGSAVVFGERVSDRVGPMPSHAEVWTGRLDETSTSWANVEGRLERQPRPLGSTEAEVESAYRRRFRQGATVVPRVLFLVERLAPGPLGLSSGTVSVRSVRTTNEKLPWKNLDSLEGVVESEFAYPLYLGQHVLPYRTLTPGRAVLPCIQGNLLHSGTRNLELYPGLAKWWYRAEKIWQENRSSDRLTLAERLDYHGGLTTQYRIQPSRIVYTKSGMHLAASRVEDLRGVIDHTLYWATAASKEEACFLCAILNAAEITRRVRPLMSYGKDERHIDKHIWRLPIPMFDPADILHASIAALGAEIEREVATLDLDEGAGYVGLRRQVRSFLEKHPKALQLEESIKRLLD